MKRAIGRSTLIITGLLALSPVSARAQEDSQYRPQSDSGYDPHYAPPRMIVALQDTCAFSMTISLSSRPGARGIRNLSAGPTIFARMSPTWLTGCVSTAKAGTMCP